MATSQHTRIINMDQSRQLSEYECFPGKIARSEEGPLVIESLLPLLIDGFETIKILRIPDGTVPIPRQDEFVTFDFNRDESRFDSSGVPFAANVEPIRELEARRLARQLGLKREIEAKAIEVELKHKQLKEIETEFKQTQSLNKLRLDERTQILDSRERETNHRAAVLQQLQGVLDQREAGLEKAEVRLKPFLSENNTVDAHVDLPPASFTALFDVWPILLQSVGYVTTTDGVPEQGFLLSLLCSLYTGGLVLLDGPVGVGKTTLVKHTAQVLTGLKDTSSIVPVRPGWIDSTDLVGFYDPIHQEFQPSVFLTALQQASSRSERLRLICLDELNLARIENYGADLLSCMEDRQERKLFLYSPDIEGTLYDEMKHLMSIDVHMLDERQKLRGTKLLQRLNAYPARFQLPTNAVIIGTLNSDETTYDVSPKVIDRAFVVRLPVANLNAITSNQARKSKGTCVLDVFHLRQVIEANLSTNSGYNHLLSEIMHLQEPLKVLGIPLSHRTGRDLEVFLGAARAIGLDKDEVILKHFLLTKILPRIRCQVNESTRTAWEVFKGRLGRFLEPDSTDVLGHLNRQWDNNHARYTVRYFDTVQ